MRKKARLIGRALMIEQAAIALHGVFFHNAFE